MRCMGSNLGLYNIIESATSWNNGVAISNSSRAQYKGTRVQSVVGGGSGERECHFEHSLASHYRCTSHTKLDDPVTHPKFSVVPRPYV